MAIMGYIKRGGDFNAEACVLYPVAVASILILGRCVWSVPRLATLLILPRSNLALPIFPIVADRTDLLTP